MATLSLSEIVNKAVELKTNKEKVEWLKRNKSIPLRDILVLMYDKKKYQFNIPNEAPPYTPSPHVDSQGMLYRETRKFKYFVRGLEGDNIPKTRREALFIQMLESVDKDDAKLLIKMIEQKPIKGLPRSVVNEAFDGILDGLKKERKDG